LASARKVFEKGTRVWFRRVDELAEVWCEWAEMEVRNECADIRFFEVSAAERRDADTCTLFACRNYDEAIKVMQRAAAIPRDWKSVDYRDEVSYSSLLVPISTHTDSLPPHTTASRHLLNNDCSNRSNFGRSTSISKNQSEPSIRPKLSTIRSLV